MVDAIWDSKVVPNLQAKAGNFPDVLALARANPDEAGRKYGNRAKEGNEPWTFAVRIEGRIVAAETTSARRSGAVSFRSAYDVFSGQPYLATGERFIIEVLGIHILDIARFLFGDVATATARTRRVNPAIRGEDVATILLDHENGITSIRFDGIELIRAIADIVRDEDWGAYARDVVMAPFAIVEIEKAGPLA